MNGCLIILILCTQLMQPCCLHPSSRNSPVVFIFWISIITVIIIITNDMSFVFTGHILHAFPTILIPVKTYTMAVNSENLTHFMYLLYDRMLSFVVGLSCVRKYADLLFSQTAKRLCCCSCISPEKCCLAGTVCCVPTSLYSLNREHPNKRLIIEHDIRFSVINLWYFWYAFLVI